MMESGGSVAMGSRIEDREEVEWWWDRGVC